MSCSDKALFEETAEQEEKKLEAVIIYTASPSVVNGCQFGKLTLAHKKEKAERTEDHRLKFVIYQ